jgi:alkyl hydroperoxide reductase subunit AhpF
MLLNRELKRETQERLSSLKRQVRLYFFGHEAPGQLCREARALVEEYAELSGRISVEEMDILGNPAEARKFEVELAPSIVIENREGRYCRFAGSPAGYGARALTEAICAAGSTSPFLGDACLAALSNLDRSVRLEAFVSVLVPASAPIATRVLKIGLACPSIRAEVIEVGSAPWIIAARGIDRVPLVFVQGTRRIEAGFSEQELAEACLEAVD